MILKYNWQHPDWPNFTYQSNEVDKIVSDYTKISSSLQGQVSQLDQENKYEAYIYLMVEEAINTSAIEGESLNREEVRSSVARYLDLELSQPRGIFHKENGIAALLINVRENFNNELSKQLICDWHKLLLSGDAAHYARRNITIGKYRKGPVDIISGPEGYEVIVFAGPPADTLGSEMEAFIDWYNKTSPLSKDPDHMPGPVRSAIAHMWFTSIHPFGDGNGRIARAISEHALFQDFETPPLFSISTLINANRDEYYIKLADSSRLNPSTDLTSWVSWFAEITKQAQVDSKNKIDFILKKSIFWDHHQETKLNKRQQKIVSKFFTFGIHGLIQNGINSNKYQSITACSAATATRDLSDLVSKGILSAAQSGGRSARYNIVLVDHKPVFNIFPKGNDKRLIDISLHKILDDIQRNIDFHQAPNSALNRLIDKYKSFANFDENYLNKLEELLSQLQDGGFPSA
jgi:Fic family protein